MNYLGLFLKVIVGIVLLFVITIGVILATVDPNDYRDEITTAVKDNTGRDFTVQNMNLSIFPKLTIDLESANFSNAEGFSDNPFMQVDKVQIGVAILPLLSKELEVDTVTLHGLQLSLEKNADGISNWDDLTRGEETKDETDKAEQDSRDNKLIGLNFGGIDIQNGSVQWHDMQSQQKIDLKNLNLNTGAITFGQFFKLELSADATVNQPEIASSLLVELEAKLEESGETAMRNLKVVSTVTGKSLPVQQANTTLTLPEFNLADNTLSLPKMTIDFDVKGGAEFPLETIKGQLATTSLSGNLENQSFTLENFALNSEMSGESIPGGSATVKVATPVKLDLQAQTASLSEVVISAMDLNAKAALNATNIAEGAKVNANLDLAQTDLRALLTHLKVTLPEMSDSKTLTQFAAQLNLAFDQATEKATITNLNVKLDDSLLKGQVSIANFKTPAIRYDLALNQMNVNRYLPPKEEQTPAPETKPAPETDIELPVEMLRKLDVKGTLKIGSLQFDNLQPKNILMTLQATKGNIQVAPLRADIFKTRVNSEAGLNVQGKTPKYNAKLNSDNVPVGDVLKAFADFDKLSGTGSVKANIETSGNKVSDFKKALNGSVSANLKNGAVKGINLAQMIRDTKAKISGEKAQKSDTPAQTDFSSLIGSFTIKNGLVNTEKLTAQAPFMRVNGSGTVNLGNDTLKYLVKTKIVGSDKGQGGKELKDLNGLTIPVKLKGALTDPDISLDLGAVLEQKTKAELEKKKKKVVEETKKKVQDQLKDSLFKGLKF